MPERFFAGNSARIFLAAEQLILLSGPPACGKTSLLFQFALNCATESGRKVVFICNKKRLDSKPPFLSQGMDPGPHILGRIQIKYVENDDEIKKFFAAFHLHETFPAAVIIDDFGDFFVEGNVQNKYCRRGRDVAMVRALALCQHALSHAKHNHAPPTPRRGAIQKIFFLTRVGSTPQPHGRMRARILYEIRLIGKCQVATWWPLQASAFRYKYWRHPKAVHIQEMDTVYIHH